MTDNEIIKALECCGCADNVCDDCPITNTLKDDCKCGEYLAKNALDLINRQQAEIEGLKNAPNVWKDIAHRETNYVAQAKSEAIKEFADRLKKKCNYITWDGISPSMVDDIAKEMTVNYESSNQRKDEGKNETN